MVTILFVFGILCLISFRYITPHALLAGEEQIVNISVIFADYLI